MQDLALALIASASDDPILPALSTVLLRVVGIAERMLPFIIHLVLVREIGSKQIVRHELSEVFKNWFKAPPQPHAAEIRLLINTILYLRTQPLPQEATKADRDNWLDVDYAIAAEAATNAGMYKSALLFIEICSSRRSRVSRRLVFAEPTDLLMKIFKQIDDPDSFYGVQQPASLSHVMDRLDYEGDGFKSLLFHGAQFDGMMRTREKLRGKDSKGIVNALSLVNLNSISLSVLQGHQQSGIVGDSTKQIYRTARTLEQWDIPAPSGQKGEEATIFKTFQAINKNSDLLTIQQSIDTAFIDTLSQLIGGNIRGPSLHSLLRTLAILTEIDECMSVRNSEELEELWNRFQSRLPWMSAGR